MDRSRGREKKTLKSSDEMCAPNGLAGEPIPQKTRLHGYKISEYKACCVVPTSGPHRPHRPHGTTATPRISPAGGSAVKQMGMKTRGKESARGCLPAVGVALTVAGAREHLATLQPRSQPAPYNAPRPTPSPFHQGSPPSGHCFGPGLHVQNAQDSSIHALRACDLKDNQEECEKKRQKKKKKKKKEKKNLFDFLRRPVSCM
ncbi:uncharacterized protein K452DRAFT_57867 [Aplosporella prunicola CBS 121167]|uniref:Uncharacterized protein n=1 Tax=Aplosporella prunicola CBS 121167 TaxID=1176127 RepID=A0A6A6B8L9_9PEZI|nr:uncharacterized protein K452DRAFT_57867 [Aplosporella prunicola CBS 121167]KAF2139908.1 hypothetical protein K452DRAFT_57867 [Aplosporella prunicola CBS 121167]